MGSRFLIASILLLFGSGVAFSQSSQPFKYQKKVEFEVTASAPMFVTTSADCKGLVLVSVFVEPRSATKENIERFAKEVSATFPLEFDLLMIFTVDRKGAMNDEDEVVYLRNLRAMYSRRTGVIRSNIFPNGTSRDDLDLLVGEDN